MDRIQRSQTLDKYWLEILFYLIGEHADIHSHQVNGAVVNIRTKGDRLSVWLGDWQAAHSVVKIGKQVKERLGIKPEQTIHFNIHNEEKIRGKNNKKYFV